MYLKLIYLAPLLLLVACDYDDKPNEYSKFDYCSVNCGSDIHSACKCARRPPREEMRHIPYVEFRTQMVSEHNKYRDLLASGKETRGGEGVASAAGNMVVVSYDLELEYIARCRAVSNWRHTDKDKTGHDKCRVRKDKGHVGQNLSGTSSNRTEFYMVDGIKMWYEEIDLVKDVAVMEKYSGGGGWGHFTQLVWWSANRLGCALVYNPDNKKSWKYSLICNYGTTIGTNAGNLLGAPVYKRSETPCDSCPDGYACGGTPAYPSLCGTQEPIPTDPPALIPEGKGGSAEAVRVDKLVVYVMVTVLCLVY